MTQLSLDSRWNEPLPPNRGEPSQIEGARKIAPRTPHLQTIVLQAIDALHGGSIEQIAEHTGLKVSTVCGRVGELKILSKIKEADFTHRSSAGVNVKVWIRT
jgi:hypothetical protein